MSDWLRNQCPFQRLEKGQAGYKQLPCDVCGLGVLRDLRDNGPYLNQMRLLSADNGDLFITQRDPIRFRVDGEPQPMPKEQAGISKGGRSYSYYRKPKKGTQKYNWNWQHWKKHIIATAQQYMTKSDRRMFNKRNFLLLSVHVYRTRPKSTSKWRKFPNVKPDLSNYVYLPENCLIGICYCDDNIIVDSIYSKRYATPQHPPGIEILICDIGGRE